MIEQYGMALMGGMLVGLSALILLLFNGRIAGISGIVAGAFAAKQGWRWLFLIGMVVGSGVMLYLGQYPIPELVDLHQWPSIAAAGLLVGLGTRLANGCTSGHGICGVGRLSRRSIVATTVFMVSAMVTVYIKRHLM